MSIDHDAATAFLAERTQGILIALRKNGHPQPSNIAYALIDGELWISVTETRAKTHNLRRDPRCAVHVTSDDFWRYVVVEAEAQLSATAAAPDDEVHWPAEAGSESPAKKEPVPAAKKPDTAAPQGKAPEPEAAASVTAERQPGPKPAAPDQPVRTRKKTA